MQTLIAVIFWISLGFTLCVAVVSPCLLRFLPRFRKRFKTRETSQPHDDSDLPTVSILFPVTQGDRYLLDRLHNLLESNYPLDRLEIVAAFPAGDELVSDLIETVNDSRVRAVRCDSQSCESDLINACLAAAHNDVVLLTDCNVRFDRETIRRLATRFLNPHVGGVCGKLLKADIDTLAATHENEYRFGIASGRSVAAFRAELIDSVPSSVHNFDRIAGLSVYRHGMEIAIEPKAHVQRRSDSSRTREGIRTKLSRAVSRSHEFFSELRVAGFSLATWAVCNHALRRIAPVFIVAAMMANAILAGNPFYLRLLILHELTYVFLLLHLCLRNTCYWPLRRQLQDATT